MRAELLALVRDLLGNPDADDAALGAMALIGGDRGLDSMKLVEICVAFEDKALEIDCEFDWTSEEAMSRSRSMFRTVDTLIAEFMRQSAGVE